MRFKNSPAQKFGAYLLIGFGLLCVYLEAVPRYSAWSTPENLGSMINSLDDDYLSDISKDGHVDANQNWKAVGLRQGWRGVGAGPPGADPPTDP